MLITTPNLTRPDESYARLIATHEGLSEAESHALNARLILILMNHIGDEAVLAEAMRLAHDPSAVWGLWAPDGVPTVTSRGGN